MTNENASIVSAEYLDLKDKITSRIRSARYEASKAANRKMLALYWEIGKRITERQAAVSVIRMECDLASMRFALPSPAKSMTGLPVKGCTPQRRDLPRIAGKSGGIGS